MASNKVRPGYFCSQCGNESLRWQGRCSSCNEWNTLTVLSPAYPLRSRVSQVSEPDVVELSNVGREESERIPSHCKEMDRVLGGGIVPGSFILLAGDPGIGKSTLLLQLAAGVAVRNQPVLYVSGEESASQVKTRSERLEINGDNVYVVTETDLESILQALTTMSPRLAIVDSIQTVHSSYVPATPGSPAQIRECGMSLMRWAKETGIPLITTGHVTKDGSAAGPRMLEHMVDAVLYLEGDSTGPYRILRSAKNRFGSTNEIGVFEMVKTGLEEVSNPSQAFLSRNVDRGPGSVVTVTLGGTRPLLVEVQALTTPTTYSSPRRICNGMDFARLLMITAVLNKHMGLPLGQQDIIVSAVGGIQIEEPASDLAVALALISTFKNLAVSYDMAVFGELGLGGEIRIVPQLDRRVTEAMNFGFNKIVGPTHQKEGLSKSGDIISVGTIKQAAVVAGLAGNRRSGTSSSDSRRGR